MLPAVLAAYGSGMVAMGACSLDACAGLGGELKQRLNELSSGLSADMTREALERTDRAVQEQLQGWGQRAACYYREKAGEAKELLLVVARTAESVVTRDQRSATQMSQITARLRQIATLDDITQMRTSVERGAAEFKSAIERMAAEGKAAVEDLRRELKAYQEKLEDAEELASRDALTGVRNRMCVERMIEARIATGPSFCVAILDIDGFKKVNDTHGHLVGDEVLKQFAGELRAASRSSDVVGRWGGDEFILLLDCELSEATGRIDRLCRWVRGEYTVCRQDGALMLNIEVSSGLAEHRHQEPLQALLARADAAMYERKAATRSSEGSAMNRAS